MSTGFVVSLAGSRGVQAGKARVASKGAFVPALRGAAPAVHTFALALSRRRSQAVTGTVVGLAMISSLFGKMGGSAPGPVRDSKWSQLEKIEGETATFGAGCFWGTEKYFGKDFETKFPGAMKATAVGYMGIDGAKPNPTYREVCTGATGHVEVAQVKFDSKVASFEDLCKFFFTFHDCTTKDRQGNDAGFQYASVVFYHTPEQKAIAEKVKAEMQAKLDGSEIKTMQGSKCETRILPATKFYTGEEYHQTYLESGAGSYCNHRKYFDW
ncbi:putative peptide methionine sulfoxide reductase [Porphyridium purpureum]|uniref:peptide-methionine (S)-S-oxide reductase n=1 Tax=Porphyridium purpureum TaxID=35688 RepID=A0A5J4YTM1_PORPP|nr:putative peptide methionine sulfoxide reductase [Porphyridium purpureum]|eukprot:POR8415..scf229_5